MRPATSSILFFLRAVVRNGREASDQKQGLNAGVLELGRHPGTEADPTLVPEPVSERGRGSLRRHQW
jgi:hypothetical protein